ncbi:tRNA (uridine(54)-C5)-methyltransferase TrmA [Pseudohalioglobus lutimaris]|uniref:tRNA/tmRNA (uracil-C(5))-methyltransferase n=1 Tax=Pseudohalioglobus lutimaris TaxID=1737061 RepID=A0A2N5WWU2_9GAMM|nr:tRNA (uridine(54)-C5)-methyltransferase TrmA [Pseudohalioglobus lutimaris]PLW66714.1 tRNA (uridine(54)-C5)-methyltransferase TrmA [Pseudohalioglobus lutimaris]
MPLSAVKPEQYTSLLEGKAARINELMSDFCPPPAQIYPSSPTAYRMRAEFRIWHDGDALDYVMFRREDPRTPVAIHDFPIGCETIQALMLPLRAYLQANPELRRKLFQVEFLATLAGDALVTLIYHRPLQDAWETQAEALRQALQAISPKLSLIGRSRKQKRILGNDWVREILTVEGREYQYQQYEQAFTQPNARVNTHMIEWACARAAKLEGDLLELYCGNGNFTIPLAAHFDQVLATELAKISVRSARENLSTNEVDNVQIIRLSAEEVTQAMNGERQFRRLAELPRSLGDYDLRTVFVDPPRAGLDEQTVKMVQGFESIIYISCNPYTLAGNLRVLCTTHTIERFAMFDQFPYTDHMECGVLLTRHMN